MKKCLMGLLLSSILCSAQAKEISGMMVPDTLTVEQVPLQLNGVGIRTKLIFDVYVIALYTAQKIQQPETLIQLNKPNRIWISFLRKVDANTMYVSLLDGLKNNLTMAEIARFKPQLEQMEKLFNRVQILQKGDTVVIDIVPNYGLKINIQEGKYKTDIASEAFAYSLLNIWLGTKPVDKKLKSVLLANNGTNTL